jgi:hypothetical protein
MTWCDKGMNNWGEIEKGLACVNDENQCKPSFDFVYQENEYGKGNHTHLGHQ